MTAPDVERETTGGIAPANFLGDELAHLFHDCAGYSLLNQLGNPFARGGGNSVPNGYSGCKFNLC